VFRRRREENGDSHDSLDRSPAYGAAVTGDRQWSPSKRRQ
jgi:hypothetical protein